MNKNRFLIQSLLLCMLFIFNIFNGFTFCLGATNQNSKVEVYEYDQNVQIIKSPKYVPQSDLSKGKVAIKLGKIKNYEGKNQMEKNLVSQIATYNSALMRGDKQNASRYIYKDAIVYFRKYYRSLSDESIANEFFKSISQSYIQQLNRFKSHGVDFDLVVPNLVRKITQGEKIYIVFNITSNICSETLYTHFSEYEQTLGISYNGGKNWSFIAINKDTPNILSISNSKEVIDAVMGY